MSARNFFPPTINLFIRTSDYFLFLENFEEAIELPINEIQIDKTGEKPKYPLGEIRLKNGDTIQIHFVHYADFDTAKAKWENRCKRVNKDNIFVFMELGIETKDEYVKRFDALSFKNKVVITSRDYSDIKSAVCIDIYVPDYTYGKMIRRIPGTPRRHIELFDYIHWINTGEVKRAKFYTKYI